MTKTRITPNKQIIIGNNLSSWAARKLLKINENINNFYCV